MIKKGKGGGNTITGLNFERGRDIISLVKDLPGYTINDKAIFYNGKEIAQSYKKMDLYRYLLKVGVDYRDHISKRLLPDEAIYVICNNTLFIIEMKFQSVGGSVDEKLQTCDFKKKQYTKLMAPLNIEVQYMYILNEWFRKPEYKDVLDYVISVGCHYYFNYLPLQKIGFPVPKNS